MRVDGGMGTPTTHGEITGDMHPTSREGFLFSLLGWIGSRGRRLFFCQGKHPSEGSALRRRLGLFHYISSNSLLLVRDSVYSSVLRCIWSSGSFSLSISFRGLQRSL